MGVMSVILTIGMISGFGLLLYGAFFLKNNDEKLIDKEAIPDPGTLDQIKQSVEDADNALSNINSVSSLIIEEIDIKYKELLFLYQMLEEKKKELLTETTGATVVGRSKGEKFAADSDYYDEDNEDRNYDGYGGGDMVPIPQDIALRANLEIMEIGRKMEDAKHFPKLKNQSAILDLYRKGNDVTDIAKELGIGKGEVKLIIGLSKVGANYE